VEAMLEGVDRDVDDRQVEDRRDDPDEDGECELDQRGIERLAAALVGLGEVSASRHERYS
jgi:hypothetical protein